jgi:hypothetical protein
VEFYLVEGRKTRPVSDFSNLRMEIKLAENRVRKNSPKVETASLFFIVNSKLYSC